MVKAKAISTLRDLAADYASSPWFTLQRLTPANAKLVDDLKGATASLTQFLVEHWRATKRETRDHTFGTVQVLRVDEDDDVEDDVENELGTCLVISAFATQGTAGDLRTHHGTLVLCMGQALADGRIEFAFCLSQGIGKVVESVRRHLTTAYGCEFSNCAISPYSLAFLAREWTREQPADAKKQRPFMEIEFKMPSQVEGVDSVTMTVPQAKIRALHELIADKGDAGAENDPTPPLMRALAGYVTAQTRIVMAGCAIVSIKTPVADLLHDGRIRFLDDAGLKRTLVQIAEATQLSTAALKRTLE